MMWKYTIEVTGMMCGMCESHVNDAVRKAFPVKKGHLVPKQKRNYGDNGNRTGRGRPARGHIRHRL